MFLWREESIARSKGREKEIDWTAVKQLVTEESLLSQGIIVIIITESGNKSVRKMKKKVEARKREAQVMIWEEDQLPGTRRGLTKKSGKKKMLKNIRAKTSDSDLLSLIIFLFFFLQPLLKLTIFSHAIPSFLLSFIFFSSCVFHESWYSTSCSLSLPLLPGEEEAGKK